MKDELGVSGRQHLEIRSMDLFSVIIIAIYRHYGILA